MTEPVSYPTLWAREVTGFYVRRDNLRPTEEMLAKAKADTQTWIFQCGCCQRKAEGDLCGFSYVIVHGYCRSCQGFMTGNEPSYVERRPPTYREAIAVARAWTAKGEAPEVRMTPVEIGAFLRGFLETTPCDPSEPLLVLEVP